MKMKNSDRQSWALLLLWVLVFMGVGAVLYVKAHAQTTVSASSGAASSAFNDPATVQRYQQVITSEGLASRLYFLASDFFEGRETTTRGQKLAAAYLASQYRRIGLKPRGTVKTSEPFAPAAYFQPFKVYKKTAKEARLEIKRGTSRIAETAFTQDAQDDLAYFAFGSLSSVKASGVVFAGHGIEDDALGYNDYAALKEKKISVNGKWVMILADEPLRYATTSLLKTKDGKPSEWSTRLIEKRMALWSAGKPAGVLIISDSGPRAQNFADGARRASQNSRGIGQLSPFATSPTISPSTYFISSKLADRILAPSGRTVKDLVSEIQASIKPSVFEMPDVEINSTVVPFEPLETENVLAYLEGSDPKLKNEVVVVTAHYDHLGVGAPVDGDAIYNGAADDGSGVVGSLALAEALMQAKREGRGPRRSVLFFNPTGEEKGLLGSGFYVDSQPVIPLDRIVANINMDGIGGTDAAHAKTNPNYIYIIGFKDTSQGLLDINQRLNDLTGIKLLLEGAQNFPSDQRNFQKILIPSIYYSTGFTEHYHRPSDEPETIDYEHLTRVVRLTFATLWQVANMDQSPQRIARDQLTLSGYKCPTCGFDCDSLVFREPGECPVCSMALEQLYEVKK